MLNPFPELLTYSFFAPTIVRVAAAALFLYVGYRHWKGRESICQTRFPVIGQGAWIAWLSTAVQLAIGASLLFGYYTQIGALVGSLAAVKGILFGRVYPSAFPLSRATYALLLAACLSLLLSGAGAFAFDLPL